MTPQLSFEKQLREVVGRAAGSSADLGTVMRLAGHASSRSYWRVGTPPRSHIVMVVPLDAKAEEVTKGAARADPPFIEVQRYLSRIGVRVPQIFSWDPSTGLMVLEDLGDQMLETRLRDSTPMRVEGVERNPKDLLYEMAIDGLAQLRLAAEAQPDPHCVAFTRSFDVDLYGWELRHFIEWALEAWKGRRLSELEADLVERRFDEISRSLDAEPKGFTHRDYQSRNLMVMPTAQGAYELAVIDFQDALLGPRQYDLVALLRDSYVELEADFVERLLRRYLARLSEGGGPQLEYAPFRAVFDLLTIQRKLKDAGRFVFIDRVKGNPDFLVSIPASLRYVREAFSRRPDLADLQEVLARHVPELAA
jgi:aminoglycoside/choline kinase family phosphotransferase